MSHFNSFLNNYMFFKSINKCQKEILRCAAPSSLACDILISNSSFKNVKNIVCDDMGAWKHNGSPLKYFVGDKSSRNNDLKPSAMKDPCYILKQIYYQNISSPDLRKIVEVVFGIRQCQIDFLFSVT